MKTEVILGGRCSGKTVELIKRSAETGRYILVKDSKRARHLFEMASDLGYRIPYPVTLNEGERTHGFEGSYIPRKGIYVDDLYEILRYLFCRVVNNTPVHAVTMTTNNPYFNYIVTYLDELKEEVESNENHI